VEADPGLVGQAGHPLGSEHRRKLTQHAWQPPCGHHRHPVGDHLAPRSGAVDRHNRPDRHTRVGQAGAAWSASNPRRKVEARGSTRTAGTAEPLEALYPPTVMSNDRQPHGGRPSRPRSCSASGPGAVGGAGGDEQQRLRRLTMIHALVMALLADPQELEEALRQAAARLAELDS
jgi:hypothetical protein